MTRSSGRLGHQRVPASSHAHAASGVAVTSSRASGTNARRNSSSMSAPMPSVPSTTRCEAGRPGVADGVVHVRPGVVGIVPARSSVEVHAVDQQPVVGPVRPSSRAPGRGVHGPLGHVDVDPHAEVGGQPARRVERAVRAGEGGVGADVPRPAGPEEALVLGQTRLRAVGTVAVGDPVGAHAPARRPRRRPRRSRRGSLDGVRATRGGRRSPSSRPPAPPARRGGPTSGPASRSRARSSRHQICSRISRKAVGGAAAAPASPGPAPSTGGGARRPARRSSRSPGVGVAPHRAAGRATRRRGRGARRPPRRRSAPARSRPRP